MTTNSADINGIRDKAAIVGIGETEFSWDTAAARFSLRARQPRHPATTLASLPTTLTASSATRWSPTTKHCWCNRWGTRIYKPALRLGGRNVARVRLPQSPCPSQGPYHPG